jgi:hypothetical protein
MTGHFANFRPLQVRLRSNRLDFEFQRGTFSSSRRDSFGDIHRSAVASTWTLHASRQSARVRYSKLLYAQGNVPLGMHFPDEEKVPRLT